MLPRGITTKDGLLTFSTIHQRYSATAHGKTLEQNIRFGKYKPDHITHEEWWKLLGPDTNNLHHIYSTYLLARDYLSAHPLLSFQDKELILLAAITHDWGEAVTGDILMPFKTEEHTTKEKEILKDLIVKELHEAVSAETADNLVSIVFDTNTPLGRHFRAIEQWGYLTTALRAWRKRQTVDDHILQKRFAMITFSVFSFDLIDVLRSSGDSTAIHSYLVNKAHITITHACDTMPQDMHEHHVNPAQKDLVHKAFAEAKEEWREFHIKHIYEKKK